MKSRGAYAATVRQALRTWAILLAAGALVATACGGDGAPAGSGITRATQVATERAAPTPIARAGATASAPRPTVRDPGLASWGAAVCGITARFDDAVAAVQDGIDPTTLALSVRIARAQLRYATYIEALSEQAGALGAVTPPRAAEPYHAALRTQLSELERLFIEQLALLERVIVASDIEEATATLQVEVEKLERSLALVTSLVSAEVRAALSAPARCSDILG